MSGTGSSTRLGVWCRQGEGWIVGLDSAGSFVRDSKGMRHIAVLLERPGDEVSALDLVAAQEGRPTAAPAADAGPVLDERAKVDYRRRLEALAARIARAERLGDARAADAARAEFEFLTAELKGAMGLGGRDRRVGSDLERARVNVTRSIRAAIDRIERQDDALGRHLRACVRTGAFCAYEPGRDAPVRWEDALPDTQPQPVPAPSAPRTTGLVTVMFLDIQDSTSLMERLGEKAWLELLATHNDVVRRQLVRHGGHEIKAMGDGFMLTFDDARQALWCAADVQRELAEHTEREPDRPLLVRIGVHVGDAVRESGDVLGRTVVLAARLSQRARGGQVLVSDAVSEAAGEGLGELALAAPGEVRLRGLRGVHRVHELVWRPGAVTGPSPDVTSPQADGVGLLEREAELATLRAALERARAGEGGLVLVEGPAGIGKSALLLTILEDAESAGVCALRARATRLESDFPFGAVRQLFDTVLRAMDPDRRARLLRGAVTPAAAMLGYGGSEEMALGETEAAQIFNGLFWLTAGLADDGPLLLVLDDAHWSDPQTIEWIEYVAARLSELPALLVVSARGGSESPLPGILSAAGAQIVSPRPLTAAAVETAVRVQWPEAAREFAGACHEASAGNPLFLREILTAARTAGIEPTAEGSRRLKEVTPESIARLVLARLRAAGEAPTALARALAILGGRAELSLTARLAELDDAAALAAADALDEAEIVDGAAPLTFAHPLIANVIERDLRAGARALLHERAAYLRLAGGAAPEAAAVHLLHALPKGDAQAVESLRAAARAARRDGAPRSAARFLERALSEPPTAEALPLVLGELGRALQDAGDEDAAIPHLERALGLAASPRQRAEVLLALSGVQGGGQDNASRVAQLDEAIALLGEEDQDMRFVLEARAIELVGLLMMSTPSPQMTEAHDERLRRVVVEARGTSAGERQLVAISAVHRAIRAAISAEEARDLALKALDDGVLMRRLAAGAWSADSAIEVLSMVDAFDEADRHARDAEQYARAGGAVNAEAFACMLRALVAWHRGALLDAESLLRSVFAITRQLKGLRYVEQQAQQIRACVSIERGDLVDAGRACEALARGALSPMAMPQGLGRLHAARGEHDLALPQFVAVSEMDQRAGIWRTVVMGPPRPDLVHTLVALGRREEAMATAVQELETARRFGSPSAVGLALRALAMAEEGDRSIEHLTEAASVLAPSLALLARAQVLCDLGSAHRAAGNLEAARHPLRQSLELSDRCGARRLTTRVIGELALAGVRGREREPSARELLSPAERRVCELAAEGAADVEIAQALFLSPRAVAEQLATAIGKLGVSSREELGQAMRDSVLVA